MSTSLKDKSILLVISGGIAAYKSLELIRLIKKSGGSVRCILTKGGEQFVTPLSVSALCEEPVYTDLWSLKGETEMGHIRLSREADLIVIAPASADIIAKTANGFADDLATTSLLANLDTPVLITPAMNHAMWNNPATQDNIEKLKIRGTNIIGPEEGDMACGEYGMGRMSEPEDILAAIQKLL
jgi:phosphopantothenoylcysteine decarboxylase/phosphopantothenate--cysteine ligase